jgi:thiosulfate/3-mercaptopyruvate sulfurtransferase
MALVPAAELAAMLHEPDLRIADVRWSLAAPAAGRVAYAEAHLPGAVFVDLDTVLTAPTGPGRHPLPAPAAFVAALASLGIGLEHRVVAYDDAGGTVTARLWWMLDVLGHPRVAVLDGGIDAWRAAGLPVSVEVPELAPAAAWPDVPATWPRTIAREELAPRLGTLTLLDGRAPERYRGEVEPIDPVAGHIPTAISAPTGTFLAPDGRFLAAAELRTRFEALGVSTPDADRAAGPDADRAAGPDADRAAGPDADRAAGPDADRAAGAGADDAAADSARPVVVACGSGVNACQLALAARAARLPDPLLYPGSYSDWSRAGMPIATGDAPGEMPAT